MILIVLDTNVLVSALLKPNSNPAKILDAILLGRVLLAVDYRIMDEYTRVLHRPKFHLASHQIDSLLRFFAQISTWVVCEPQILNDSVSNDLSDRPFIEVAISSSAQAIVTGNTKHFSIFNHSKIQVLNPTEFLVQYG